ncbi:MAG TPA: hypothetical protein PKE40_15880, partial [Arachnia sp.]|nr:hypothetical protein [Arachnia sp.]HMT87820.1 hypothetical protein [Arachnia sp.]
MKRLLRAGAIALAATLALSACGGNGEQETPAPPTGLDGSQMLTIPREDTGTFDRNFNPFANPDFPMTHQAIYESMFIF